MPEPFERGEQQMNFLGDYERIMVPGSVGKVSGARIGHLNLRVADLDRATDFYCDVLGLTIRCYGPDIGLPTVFLAFGDYHHHIALNWFYGDVGKAQSRLNHFAIVYPDKSSLAKAVLRVLQHGVSIDDARDHGGTVSMYLHDLDGNGIELYYDRPRSHWVDANGHLVVKSEPFDVKQWLKDALQQSPEIIVSPCAKEHWLVMQ
jgi:catechol 2,3-dioxygenase